MGGAFSKGTQAQNTGSAPPPRGEVGRCVSRCCLHCFYFVSPSQSLQEEEEEEAARGTKEKARATAPIPQQPPLHQEWEAAEPPTPLPPYPPPPPPPPPRRLRRHSTKCLHLTNYNDRDIGAGHSSLQLCLPFFLCSFLRKKKRKINHRVL